MFTGQDLQAGVQTRCKISIRLFSGVADVEFRAMINRNSMLVLRDGTLVVLAWDEAIQIWHEEPGNFA